MHFYAFKIDYYQKEEFKEFAKEFGMRARFDFRMKRWEMFGRKLSNKRLNILKGTFGEVWEWQTEGNCDPYSKNVYRPAKSRRK